MKKQYFFLLVISFFLFSCDKDSDSSQSAIDVNVNCNNTAIHYEYARLEFPHLKDDVTNIVIIHRDNGEVNYSLEWDLQKHSQRWSCYELYRSNMVTNTSRYYSDTSQYPQDPDLPKQYQFTSDPFWNSGFQHGHICPSADRLNSSTANYQTFYLTNMQPLVGGFNTGVWEKMEEKVREIARRNGYSFCDTLYVCKGGTIDTEENIITRLGQGLIVPKYFFMALLSVKNGQYHAFGFWVENRSNSDENLAKYAVTIDELEEKTGIDFFCNLPDKREALVESAAVVDNYWGLY
jgi:endonuclease G